MRKGHRAKKTRGIPTRLKQGNPYMYSVLACQPDKTPKKRSGRRKKKGGREKAWTLISDLTLVGQAKQAGNQDRDASALIWGEGWKK